MKIWVKLLLLYVLVMLGMAYVFQVTYKHFKEESLTLRTATQRTGYASVLQSNRILADTFFNEVLNREEILIQVNKIVHSEGEQQRIQRGLLYRALAKVYQRSNKVVAELLHFHFPDNRSMLRLHLPQKVGDDLTDKRPSVALANSLLRDVHGYESGRYLSGYRHVYPLKLQGEHIGSVEISNPYHTIYRKVQQLGTATQSQFIFFQKRAGLFEKLFKGQEQYYVSSEVHQDFVRRRFIPELTSDLKKKNELSAETSKLLSILKSDDLVQRKMPHGEEFSLYIHTGKDIFSAVFHPVINVSGKDDGYLLGITPEPQVQGLAAQFWGYYLGTGFVLYGFFLYRGFLQKTLEQKRKDQKLLQTITTSMGEGVYAVDAKGDITYINPVMEQMLGYPTGELLQKNAHEFFHLGKSGQKCLLSPNNGSESIRRPLLDFKHRQGHTFPVSAVSTLILENGEMQGTITVVHDITEQVRQQELVEKDLKLRTAISELYYPLIAKDQTLAEIAQLVLNQAKLLTGSEHGYVGEIDPRNDDLIVHTLTDMFAGHNQVEEKHQHIIFPKGEDGLYPKLWGLSLNTQEGMFSNDPLTHAASMGLPSGHIPLKQFLSVPVVINDQLIGQIALANPGREYLQEDLAQLAHLVEFYALAIQRTRTMETLRRYEQIISTSSEMMAFVDSDQIYQAVNDAYLKFFKTTRDKVIGRHVREIVGTERYEQQTKRKVKQCLQGKIVIFQSWANYPNVGRHHLDVKYSPYIEQDGEVSGFVARVRDITLQTDQEAKLRLSAKVFESTTEGVTITDREGCILAINQAFSTITGYPEEEVLGKNPRILQSGRHNEAFYQEMWGALEKAGHWQGEIWNQRKNGEIYPERLTISSVKDESGEISNYVAVFSDISSSQLALERLEHQAHHHPLTGLPNRLLLYARLTHSIQRAQREKHLGAVLFIDLDNFKNVNDSLGHMAGDEVLKAVSIRLSEHNRQVDTLAHLSGDEFVVVLECVDSLDAATSMAQQLLNKLQQPFVIQDYELYLGGSIGITLFPGDGNDVDSLLKNADAAMYKAKESGKNCYQIYTPELTETAIKRVQMESHLRRVLENNELVLHYQPQVTVPEGKVVAVEALVRWQHPDMGLIPPDKFIPLSEETGMIIPMGEWILKTACEQLVAWRRQGLEIKKIAVNLSGRQLQQKNLLEMVERVLRETGCPATSLELEITEGFIMQHPEQSVAVLQQIRNLGVDLAVDDFGTGHSSLNYLKKLPINRLKIDRSFVWDIHQNPEGEAIIKAIIAMGHSLNLEITAEGVETAEQLAFLAERGCNEAQGFLFSRAIQAEELERLLRMG